MASITGFAVQPKYDCPHVETLNLSDLSRFGPIKNCGNIGENWVCLTCAAIRCSFYVKKHMLDHYKAKKHPIVLSFSDMSFWCYECDSYIESPALYELRQLFQNKKFSATTTMAEIEKSIGSLGMVELKGTAEEQKAEVKEEGKEFTIENVASKIKNGKIKNVVVLTGAGLSVSAGIPDFRSPGSGLYSQMSRYDLPYPEAVFTLDYFLKNPEPFYTIAKGMMGKYFPTKAHYFIRLLQDKGILLRNFTQNIDNLEIDAGVKPELLVQAHGTITSSHCAACHKEIDQKLMMDHLAKGQPLYCPNCKGPCKPDIIMFGESLPMKFSTELGVVSKADLVLVIGTSLKVFPFSAIIGLVNPNSPRIIMDRIVPDIIAATKDNRDIILLGDCDETAEKLVNTFGFESDFKKLMEEREELIKKHEAEKAKQH